MSTVIPFAWSLRSAPPLGRGAAALLAPAARTLKTPSAKDGTSTLRHKRFRPPATAGLWRVAPAAGGDDDEKRASAVDGSVVINRNPMTAKLEGRAPLPRGFATNEARKPPFVHRLRLRLTGRHAYALCDACDGSVVLETSTQQPDLAQRLYGTNDRAACRALGLRMGTFLMQSGLRHVTWDREHHKYHGKARAFIDAVRDAGVHLGENPAVIAGDNGSRAQEAVE